MQNGDRQRGFGYLLVLFAIAAMGLLLAGTGQVWHTTAQREKEAELLFVGGQFANAIAAYHESTPGSTAGAAKQYPPTLQDLLADKRFPMPRRHLRQIYRDPMTGSAEWGLIKAGDRIVGVHSLSADKPLRTDFSGRYRRYETFANAMRYDQWVFGAAVAKAAPVVVSGVGDAATSSLPGTEAEPDANKPETAISAARPEATVPVSPVVPAAESNPCDAAYLDELRSCKAGAGQAAAVLHLCNRTAAARYAACRQGR